MGNEGLGQLNNCVVMTQVEMHLKPKRRLSLYSSLLNVSYPIDITKEITVLTSCIYYVPGMISVPLGTLTLFTRPLFILQLHQIRNVRFHTSGFCSDR